MKNKALFPIISSGLSLLGIVLMHSCATAPYPAVVSPPDSQSAPAAGSANYAASEAPRSRPGLGTGWGDELESEIGYTSFNRTSSKPAGVAAIYYNDKEGVNAMVDSWKYSGKGMQKAAGGLVEWGVKGSWGSLKNYHTRYSDNPRRYVVGRKNSNYSLVVKNLSHSRLEIVLSVDGLDVMDGKAAAYRKRGYIVQPGKTLVVDGFRTSESAVAAFKFSSVDASYSNQRHGTTRNVGVIGMAVFTEKGIDPWKWSRAAVKQRHGASPFAEAPYSRAQ
ncbi:hypothetical protein HW115_16450 [Verrucomicrobiaceae bacterium N1E253]|uniref:Uncharacterized protein n=1 Tax=Oceaniferula marina TaxID=2748318 RepID=A0A851GQ22_9BACT|nr:hypothetical protein [Oceaniferula marina]NWK57215.1 hypothetical protein [Oceaniferula marina]